MVAKLKAVSGETMVETLVSILISALALLVLATVISTSVRLVDNSRKRMDDFYATESDLSDAEKTQETQEKLTLGVPLKTGTDANKVAIDVYSSNKTSVVYYERSATP